MRGNRSEGPTISGFFRKGEAELIRIPDYRSAGVYGRWNDRSAACDSKIAERSTAVQKWVV